MPAITSTVDKTSLAVREVFQACQEDSVSVAKSVLKFRKIWDVLQDDEGQQEGIEGAPSPQPHRTRRHFFERFVFYLRLPLTFKERTSYVDRCLEVACRFAASFLAEEKANNDKAKDSDKEEGSSSEESSDLAELPPFVHKLFNWLLDHHEVEGSQARLRICLMVNNVLKLMGEDASIDDDLYQKIYDNMLQRLKDKVADIRSQAVTALQRLQDPGDENCPIIKAFIFHMANDPSPAVRRMVVKVIGATRITLPHVLKRTKDVDENVRKAAFQFIAEKVHIKSLTIAQREQILSRGLNDRAEGVKAIVKKDLVASWLRICNHNIVELLYALDVGNSDGKVAGDMLKSYFKGLPYKEIIDNFKFIDENKLIPYDKLTAETACYWNTLTSFLFSEGGGAQDLLDNLLPELTAFCNYLRHYIIGIEKPVDEVSWMFVAKQLIEMTSVFDLADEVGRNNLGKLCKDVMAHKKVTAVFMEPLMPIFASVRTNVDSRIQEVVEIIAELRDPMKEEAACTAPKIASLSVDGNNEAANRLEQRKRQVEIAKLKVELNIMKNDLEEAVQNKDFLRAQELKLTIEKLDVEQNRLQDELTEAASMVVPKAGGANTSATATAQLEVDTQCRQVDDPVVIQKCLEMVFQLMQDPEIKTLNPMLMTLLDEFILPSIQNLEPEIRKVAVKAIGVCSIRSIDVAKRQLLLLFQIGRLDQTDVRLAALAMVNDLLLYHGLSAFITLEEGGGEPGDDQSVIESMLDSELSGTSRREGYDLTQLELNTQGGNSVVAILTRLLDDQNLEIRTKVAEGLCKMLMVGTISSPKLLQRLILMWYNPIAESDGMLRHILGTFFPLYASISRANQDSIEEAFIPTLKTLFDAPATSPLADVDVEDVGTFLIQLTREDFLQARDSQGPNVHDEIAFSLCNEIISSPDNFYTKSLIKLLLNLQLSTNDFVKLRELKKLHQEMSQLVKEKICQRNLEKFGSHITDCLAKDPDVGAANDNDSDAAAAVNGNDDSQSSLGIGENDTHYSNKSLRRRVLFSQTNNTLLPSPDGGRGESEEIESVSSSVSSSPMGPPTSADVRRRQQRPVSASEVTRIEETSEEEEEEEEEELVSGNLHRGQGKLLKVRIAKEQEIPAAARPKTKQAADEIQNVSVEKIEVEDDIFGSQKSTGMATSTQAPVKSDDSSNSQDVVESFFSSAPGKPARKLRKKASTTEEEEEEEMPKEADKLKRRKNLKKTHHTEAKKKAAASDYDDSSSSSPRKITSARALRKKVATAKVADAEEILSSSTLTSDSERDGGSSRSNSQRGTTRLSGRSVHEGVGKEKQEVKKSSSSRIDKRKAVDSSSTPSSPYLTASSGDISNQRNSIRLSAKKIDLEDSDSGTKKKKEPKKATKKSDGASATRTPSSSDSSSQRSSGRVSAAAARKKGQDDSGKKAKK